MNFDIGEYYPFRSNGSVYFMALPSCSIWQGDDLTFKAIEELKGGVQVSEERIHTVLNQHFPAEAIPDIIDGLKTSQILKPSGSGSGDEIYRNIPVESGQITHLICNVSHSCNLSCRYCYADSGRYGGETGMIDEATARSYVDFLLDHSGNSPRVGMTFFGGEPLLNFPVIVSTVQYAVEKAAERKKMIKFDLTTNGTLLDEEKISFLDRYRVMVTVSMDGPRETHDRTRLRKDGSGSYDIIVEKLKPLLKSRPVPARVTMTRLDLDVKMTIDHLLDLGFAEVGISPVDVHEDEELGLGEADMERLSEGFEGAADIYLKAALEGGYYGFTNVTNLLKQFHEGISKAYPCGAGMHLYAGDPDGRLYMCHRLVGRSDYSIGTLSDGIDTEKQKEFLTSVSMLNKEPCQDCWIRYICSGGCYYQSVLHYNDHTKPYLPKCDWLRRWFNKTLEVYVTLLEKNPSFIEKHAGDSLLC